MKKRKPTLLNFRNTNDLTLFLDRDGVINIRLVDDYVKSPADFHFAEGFLSGLASISRFFKQIIVVTNQQGIGKGLMTVEDLNIIHRHLLKEVEDSGGRIDKIYFCPDLKSSGSLNRKPEVGMALKARHDFPDINFRNSIMVGDSLTDLEFGRKLKMKTVYIDNGDLTSLPCHLADYRFKSFSDFAQWIIS